MSTTEFTSTAFYENLNENKLTGSRCRSCGEKYLPPREICPNCFNTIMERIEFRGAGRLTAFTIIHIAPTAMIEAGYGRDNPYCSGIVTLDEGPSISAQILGVDVNDPTNIEIGSRVELNIVQRSEEDNHKSHLAFKTID